MIHLAPCAFVPISIFSGTALIGAIISAWISYAAKPVRHPLTASWRCVCRWNFIWCRWLVFSTIPGSKVSVADLATPAMPTADAPTTVPIRPIIAMSMP